MSTALLPHSLPDSPSDVSRGGGESRSPLAALESSGGLIRLDDLASRLALQQIQTPLMTVRRWVVQRKLMGFPWRGTRVFPAFQFVEPAMAPRDEIGEVLAEFAGAYDDWEVLDWFLRPNSFLDDDVPARRLATIGPTVVQAARADRFIASL